MATRNPRPVVDLADPNDPSFDQLPAITPVDPDSVPEPTSADRIASLLTDVRDDDRAKVKLWRIRPDARTEWCSDYTPSEFEMGGFEMIRRDWGVGKYRVVLYASLPGNQFGIRAKEEITIAPMAPGASTPRAAADDAVTALGRMLIEAQERQTAMLAQLVQARQPQGDLLQQMTAMATMMKELRGAFGGDSPAPRQSDPLTMIETMRSMREFAVELQTGKPADPERDPNADMMDLAKQVMGLIAAGQHSAQPAQPVMLPPSLVAPETVPVMPVAAPAADPLPPVETDPEAAMLKLLFKSYMDTLIKQAETGAPIEQSAQLVADKLPDMLVPMLDLPDWFEKLAAIDSRVVAHREYITKVRDAALPLLFEGDS